MIFITFLTAIALSAVAAYYSVIGLASIFPGSFWPVVLMGAVLESSKLVTVSWLYRNWTRAPFLMKTYMSVAVTILMLITSMGIFGYLSKAHLEHSSDTSPLQSRIELLQEKIRVERETIEESRKELKQLDSIVEQTVGRSTDEKGLLQAQALRRTQQKDRGRLVSQIEQSQKSIAGNQEELAPLSVEFKKAEADLGPIKYVAALAYGEEAGVGAVEKAVRFVIGLIIVVFDPLAILLLIAANVSMQEKSNEKKIWPYKAPPNPETTHTENDFGVMAQEIANVMPEIVATSDDREMVMIDQARINELMIKAIQEMHDKDHNVDPHAYLKQPFKHFEGLKPMVAPKPEIYAGNPDDFKEPWPEDRKEKLVEAMQGFFDDNKKIQVEKDNVFVLDEITGETMPPISTKYDYDANFAFAEKTDKKPVDGGKF